MPTFGERARRGALPLALAAGTVALLAVVDRHYPLRDWLVWTYARAWLLAITWAVACLSVGHAIVVRARREALPAFEHLVVAFAVGVVAFFGALFGLGLAGLLGRTAFFGAPLVFLTVFGRDFALWSARLVRHVAAAATRPRPGLTLTENALSLGRTSLAAVGLLLVYLPVLSPENASWDARWYHLPIAEMYAASGAIAPFREGWYLGAYPQLASVTYAWAFLAPASDLFARVELCAHIEVICFLASLAGVSAIGARLVPNLHGGWVAALLFPGLFVYDSGLVLGADHVAALFAAPAFLLLLRALRSGRAGDACLLGIVLGGALDTKYTAVALVAFPVGTLLVTAALRSRREGAMALRAPLVVGLVTLVVWSPHWAKNWAFYGDPFYPLLRHHLAAHPIALGAELPTIARLATLSPPPTLGGAWETLRTLVTFSFEPHDWVVYHGGVPVFGSLFTLTAFVLPLLRARRTHWLLLAGTQGSVLVWYALHPFDRYLQALLPWMAASTAAALALAWRAGGMARVAVGVLVGTQLVWGATLPFLPTHRAAGGAILPVVFDLFAAGMRGERATRRAPYGDWTAVGATLPPGAVVLVHEATATVGLGVRRVSDAPGTQGALYYGLPGRASVGEIHGALRELTITHLVWSTEVATGESSLASDLLFFHLTRAATHHARRVGALTVAELAEGSPPEPAGNLVTVLPCDGRYSRGVYDLSELVLPGNVVGPPVRPQIERPVALSETTFLVVDTRCEKAPTDVDATFVKLASRGSTLLFERR